MKALLIAEKPSLMRDIQSVYNTMSMSDEITFMCFVGHVMSLAKPGDYKEEWGVKKWTKDMLPMIPDKFKCVVSPDKKDMFNKLKNEINSNKYDYLINACDPDREAQAIWKNFTDYLGCKLPVKRFWSNDITEESVKAALLNLRDNDNEPFLKNLTTASQLRGHFDWLVGMNLTTAATLKMGTCHIGRVKTPTLKILVDRELEIQNFKPTTTYELIGVFGGYSGVYFDEEGNVVFKTKEEAESFAQGLSKNAIVESVTKKNENSYSPQLYSLNMLQQDANKLFGYTAEKTKKMAQSLYDKKILSYPRTDNPYISTKLAKKFSELCRTVEEIEELSQYAKMIANDKELQAKVTNNKTYVNDAKMDSSGHYAITPTGTKPNLASLNEDEINILTLVCRRFVSIFLPPKKILKTEIITNDGGNLFKTSGRKILDKGYTILYPNDNSEDIELPDVKEKDTVQLTETKVNEKVSKAPPRYTEGTLLAAMVNPIKFLNDGSLKQTLKEVKGIGTEATRDGIIAELIKSGYIETKKKTILPSQKAILVIQNLKDKKITSVDLTGIWENKLSEIENGTLDATEFRREMIEYVLSEIDSIDSTEMIRLPDGNNNGSSGEILGKCPKCGGSVIEGKSFYLCEHYKKEENSCDFLIKKVVMGAKITKTDITALLKGKATKEKELTKKDNTKITKKLIINSDGVLSIEKAESIGKCPKCGADVLNGKYYLCKNYKNGCDFIIGKTYGEAEITIEDAKALIEMKQTPTQKNCKWKSGNTSTVFLKLDENFKIAPIYENKPKQEIKEVGNCPKCGGKVMSSNNFYYCENHPNSCKFSIKKSLKGATITDEDINHLLNNEPTDKIMFTWNSQKKSEARLKYTDKLEFVFE